MIRHCSKCGCELDENAKFCPNCGFEQGKDMPKQDKQTNISSTEEIPLQIIFHKIARHKVLSIISILVLILLAGGYYGYKKYSKEKEAKELVEGEVKHLLEISGTYKANNGIKLELSSDGTANITTNNGEYYVGYWREKMQTIQLKYPFRIRLKLELEMRTMIIVALCISSKTRCGMI